MEGWREREWDWLYKIPQILTRESFYDVKQSAFPNLLLHPFLVVNVNRPPEKLSRTNICPPRIPNIRFSDSEMSKVARWGINSLITHETNLSLYCVPNAAEPILSRDHEARMGISSARVHLTKTRKAADLRLAQSAFVIWLINHDRNCEWQSVWQTATQLTVSSDNCPNRICLYIYFRSESSKLTSGL